MTHNREDADLAEEATHGLLLRGQPVARSIPEPRHIWGGRLDPEWREKFEPALLSCDVAVLARRQGVRPNPGTQTEIDILTGRSVPIVVYEQP